MKKRLITLLLCFATLSVLTACADKQSAQTDTDVKKEVSDERRSNVRETDKVTGEEYYLIADFENYYECTQVKYQGAFGTVTEITKTEEPDMVTYGEQSAKLEILGTEQTWRQRNPIMRFATTSAFFNATTNFTNLSKFTFDIYNAMDYEVTIRFYADYEIDPQWTLENQHMTNDNYEYCITTKITLQPNQWNHVEIPVEKIKMIEYDTAQMPYLVYGSEGLDAVGAFCLMFDRGELHEEQQVYYIDNVRAYIAGE